MSRIIVSVLRKLIRLLPISERIVLRNLCEYDQLSDELRAMPKARRDAFIDRFNAADDIAPEWLRSIPHVNAECPICSNGSTLDCQSNGTTTIIFGSCTGCGREGNDYTNDERKEIFAAAERVAT